MTYLQDNLGIIKVKRLFLGPSVFPFVFFDSNLRRAWLIF